ncbi:hypothetical protein TRAPUB_2054 [Trametes pubescens]|uniref:Uncharacterized protein n=1 Tax=Trametes pubescens TaxID=154538 RepID=A0A1M2VHQ3_TRAPU|nr:hypothetical protein TRAPUB_2054 [Trametes pubescens]
MQKYKYLLRNNIGPTTAHSRDVRPGDDDVLLNLRDGRARAQNPPASSARPLQDRAGD